MRPRNPLPLRLRMVPSPAATPPPRGRRPGRVAAAVLAAAAIVAVAVLGVEVVRQQHRIDDLAAEMHGDPMRQEALRGAGVEGLARDPPRRDRGQR